MTTVWTKEELEEFDRRYEAGEWDRYLDMGIDDPIAEATDCFHAEIKKRRGELDISGAFAIVRELLADKITRMTKRHIPLGRIREDVHKIARLKMAWETIFDLEAEDHDGGG